MQSIQRVRFEACAPVDSQILLQMVNSWIINTTQLINKFSGKAEAQLNDVSSRLAKLEVIMTLLETKLESVDLGDWIPPEVASAPTAASAGAPPAPIAPAAPAAPVMTVRQDPRYKKYIKLMEMNVDVMRFQAEMTAEGLDPALLSNLDQPVPDAPGSSVSSAPAPPTAPTPPPTAPTPPPTAPTPPPTAPAPPPAPPGPGTALAEGSSSDDERLPAPKANANVLPTPKAVITGGPALPPQPPSDDESESSSSSSSSSS